LAGRGAALSKTKLSEDDSAEFVSTVTDLLRDYRSSLGEGAEATYRIRRRLGRVEFVAAIPGERIDPFDVGEHADIRNEQRKFGSLSLMQTTTTHANRPTFHRFIRVPPPRFLAPLSTGAEISALRFLRLT
jgi:hypothetical protein